jgi:hypothetical protein
MVVPFHDEAACTRVSCPHCGSPIVLRRYQPVLIRSRHDLAWFIGAPANGFLIWVSSCWLIGVGWWSAAQIWPN